MTRSDSVYLWCISIFVVSLVAWINSGSAFWAVITTACLLCCLLFISDKVATIVIRRAQITLRNSSVSLANKLEIELLSNEPARVFVESAANDQLLFANDENDSTMWGAPALSVFRDLEFVDEEVRKTASLTLDPSNSVNTTRHSDPVGVLGEIHSSLADMKLIRS